MHIDRWYIGGLIIYQPTMDIVYLLKDEPIIDELTLSLRSLVHVPHDKIFFVGGFPTNINPEKVYHIEFKQKGTKYKNTTNMLKAVSKNLKISDKFILMNDDFMFMEDIKDPETELNLHRGYVDDIIKDYLERYKGQEHPYVTGMEDTKRVLQGLGYVNPLSYELHIPIVMHRTNLQQMFRLPGLDAIPVLHKRTLYGNMYLRNSQYTEDVKMDLHHPELPQNTKFLSTSDMYFRQLKPFLLSMFDKPSEYEL